MSKFYLTIKTLSKDELSITIKLNKYQILSSFFVPVKGRTDDAIYIAIARFETELFAG
jgi:hypothetical protein